MSQRMSVIRIIVLHWHTKFEVSIGLPDLKIWTIFGHGVNRLADLDLPMGSRFTASFLSIFSFLGSSIFTVQCYA